MRAAAARMDVEDANLGQAVRAKVMKVEEGGKRIGLSMKALEPDP